MPVVIISEAEWKKRVKGTQALVDLFLQHAGDEGFDDVLSDRSWYKGERPLGGDFAD